MHCETLSTENTAESAADLSEAARRRLLSIRGEPLLLADWLRPVFIHYEVPSNVLQRDVPFELDLRDGKAYVSLVAFTMRRMRPFCGGALTAWLLKPIANNDFLNVRTYVRHRGEPGIYFLTEWMNNPISVHLGPATFGLPYRFGQTDYHHRHENGILTGTVRETTPGPALERVKKYYSQFGARIFGFWRGFGEGAGLQNPVTEPKRSQKPKRPLVPSFSPNGYRIFLPALDYQAPLTDSHFTACPARSLDEFLLERYTAFTSHRTSRRFFRIWHEPWKQQSIQISVSDITLLKTVWPWFADAKLAHANYSPGAHDVCMGRPRRVRV